MAEAKLKYLKRVISKMQDQIENASIFDSWSTQLIDEKLQLLSHFQKALEENYLALDEATEADEKTKCTLLDDNLNMAEASTMLKAVLRKRHVELQLNDAKEFKQMLEEKLNVVKEQEKKLQEEEMQEREAVEAKKRLINDGYNTIGKFEASYLNWFHFEQNFMKHIHENENFDAQAKLEILKLACSTKKIEQTNYDQALSKLKDEYNNNYMQTLAVMTRLMQAPKLMRKAKGDFERIVHIVQILIEIWNAYSPSEAETFIVPFLIHKMDSDMYNAWEAFRANSKAIGEANNASLELKQPAKWECLKHFLLSANAAQKEQIEQDVQQPGSSGQCSRPSVPSYFKCELCDGLHPIYKCQIFLGFSLNAKMNYVKIKHLCKKCLRPADHHLCKNPQSNEACPSCAAINDQTIYHNSTLCPSKNDVMTTDSESD